MLAIRVSESSSRAASQSLSPFFLVLSLVIEPGLVSRISELSARRDATRRGMTTTMASIQFDSIPSHSEIRSYPLPVPRIARLYSYSYSHSPVAMDQSRAEQSGSRREEAQEAAASRNECTNWSVLPSPSPSVSARICSLPLVSFCSRSRSRLCHSSRSRVVGLECESIVYCSEVLSFSANCAVQTHGRDRMVLMLHVTSRPGRRRCFELRSEGARAGQVWTGRAGCSPLCSMSGRMFM